MFHKLSNKPLISGILLVLILVSTQCTERYSKYFTIKIGTTSYNISNRWYHKFHYLDGTRQGRFIAKNDSAKLIYSGNIEEGTIVFKIYDRADSIIATFPPSNNVDTIRGIFEKGGKYRIRASAKNAKGRFDFKME